MPETHDVLVDAAEQIVREQGLEAVTVRSLAAVTNYGKSTVHASVGGIAALTQELRDRAAAELHGVMTAETPIEADDIEWRARAFDRLARWIIENPNWAEACFVASEAPRPWSRTVAEGLVGSLPEGLDDLDEHDIIELMNFMSRMVTAFMPMIIHVRDVDFAAQRLSAIFTTVRDAIVHLIAIRGVGASASPA